MNPEDGVFTSCQVQLQPSLLSRLPSLPCSPLSGSLVRCPTPNPRVGLKQQKPGKGRQEEGRDGEDPRDSGSREAVEWGGRERQREIEGGAGGTLTGKRGHLEAERGSGRDSTATYPPGHEPAPRVLGSGGHGLGLIAAGGLRGPRRLRGSPSGQDPQIAAEGGGGSSTHTGPACVTSGSSRGDA